MPGNIIAEHGKELFPVVMPTYYGIVYNNWDECIKPSGMSGDTRRRTEPCVKKQKSSSFLVSNAIPSFVELFAWYFEFMHAYVMKRNTPGTQ